MAYQDMRRRIDRLQHAQHSTSEQCKVLQYHATISGEQQRVLDTFHATHPDYSGTLFVVPFVETDEEFNTWAPNYLRDDPPSPPENVG